MKNIEPQHIPYNAPKHIALANTPHHTEQLELYNLGGMCKISLLSNPFLCHEIQYLLLKEQNKDIDRNLLTNVNLAPELLSPLLDNYREWYFSYIELFGRIKYTNLETQTQLEKYLMLR